MVTAVLGTVYFFIDANYLFNGANYRALVYLDLVSQFITLSLFPMMLIYIQSMNGKEFSSISIGMMLAPAVLMGGAATIIYLAMGVDNAATYMEAYDLAGGRPAGYEDKIYAIHDLFTMSIYNTLVGLWIALIWFQLVFRLTKNGFRAKKTASMLHEGRFISLQNIIYAFLLFFLFICLIRVVIGRTYLRNHHVISWILTISLSYILSQMFYISYWFQGGKVRYKFVGAADTKAAQIRNQAESEVNEEQMNALFRKFLSYIDEQKPYLDSSLSLDKVASDLSTNRTYVSEMMRVRFGTNFRNYINNLRVEEAKERLLEDPDAHLESIAAMSGFTSDSQLVKKFNEITGEPPRAWLKHQAGNENRQDTV